MISLITYSDKEPFNTNGQNLIKQASYQFDNVRHYKPLDISDFIEKNRHIFKYERGGGLWCWKPYIFKLYLSQSMDNDLVLYCDTDVTIGDGLAGLVRGYFDHNKDKNVFVVKNHHFFRHSRHKEVEWSKGDAFNAIGVDMFRMYEELQVWSGFICFRNTTQTRQIVEDWLKFATDEQIISHSPSVYPNHPLFKDHRNDQTILSLVLKKHYINLSDNYLSDRLVNKKYIKYITS